MHVTCTCARLGHVHVPFFKVYAQILYRWCFAIKPRLSDRDRSHFCYSLKNVVTVANFLKTLFFSKMSEKSQICEISVRKTVDVTP